jgi:F0F1-type ATP synthase assembly protein I
MAILDDPSRKRKRSQYAPFTLLAAIPAVLVGGPLIGFFIGDWADGKLATEPYLMILGVLLGFGAAGVEVYGLVKKSQALEEEKDDR